MQQNTADLRKMHAWLAYKEHTINSTFTSVDRQLQYKSTTGSHTRPLHPIYACDLLIYWAQWNQQRVTLTSQKNWRFTVRLHFCNARYCQSLSVRLSVCQTSGLWQNERHLCPHYYTAWKVTHPGFLTKNRQWRH